MEYRGYYGTIEFSASDEALTGTVVGISNPIPFEGDSLKSLREDFEAAVDGYLDACARTGVEPEKSYKRFDGNPPSLHKGLSFMRF
jgi:predicted HicB family RNase H-like nuclease